MKTLYKLAPTRPEERVNVNMSYVTLDRFCQEQVDKDGVSPAPTLATPPGPTARRVKVGRNDPCPCGSGKKYKKCCL